MALAERWQVNITTWLHPLCKEEEYKLAYICDPKVANQGEVPVLVVSEELRGQKQWGCQACNGGGVGKGDGEGVSHSVLLIS